MMKNKKQRQLEMSCSCLVLRLSSWFTKSYAKRDVFLCIFMLYKNKISGEINEYDILFWICIIFANVKKQILVKIGCLSNHDDHYLFFLLKNNTNVHLHYTPNIHKSSAWESLLSYFCKKDASLTKKHRQATK